MVKFESKIDSNGRIYIAKALRRSGVNDICEMQHWGSVLIVYKKGTPVSSILESLRIHIADLELQQKEASAL